MVQLHLIAVNDERDETVTGSEFSLAGLNIAQILGETDGDGTWADSIATDLVFPADAIGYQLQFSADNVHYQFNDWSCAAGEEFSGLCNYVWHLKGTANDEDAPATTLAGFEVSTPAVLNGVAEGLNGIQLGWMGNTKLVAEFITGGTIKFYKVNSENQTVALLTTGSWDDITVHDKILRIITGPDLLHDFDGFYGDREQIFLFEYLGAVRVGEVRGLATSEDGELTFNNIARDAIVDNFDISLLP
jgi:hypothetical protein